MTAVLFVSGIAAGALFLRNFADTTVGVRHTAGIEWHNDDLGPVNTAVTGYGTCTWGPQGLGTFFKTATISFTGVFEGSACVIGRQVSGMGELFIANQEPNGRTLTVTGFDYGKSGYFCATGGGCPVEVTLINGRFEGDPVLTFPFTMGVGEAREVQLILTVNGAVANPDDVYHDTGLGFIAHP